MASLPTGPLVPGCWAVAKSPLLKRSSTRQLRRCALGSLLLSWFCAVLLWWPLPASMQSVCWYPNPMAPRNCHACLSSLNTSVFVSCSREQRRLPRHPEMWPLSRCRVGSCLPPPAPQTPLDVDITPLEAVARRDLAQPVKATDPRRLWAWRAESQQLLSPLLLASSFGTVLFFFPVLPSEKSNRGHLL